MAFLIATSVNPLFLFENTRAAKEMTESCFFRSVVLTL